MFGWFTKTRAPAHAHSATHPNTSGNAITGWAISSQGKSVTGASRAANQDCFSDWQESGLWVVADGLGGHAKGIVASRILCGAMKSIDTSQALGDVLADMKAAMLQVHGGLVLQAQLSQHPGMGTTAVALCIKDRHAGVVWVGDSRLYRYRAGQVEQITRDHSVVATMVASGQITAQEAALHPDRNVLSQAIGTNGQPSPDTRQFEVHAGDRFLLCSDGAYGVLSDAQLKECLERISVDAINRSVLSLARTEGSTDDMTVISVAVDDAN